MSPKHAKTEQAIAQMENDQDQATEAKVPQEKELTKEEREEAINALLTELRQLQKAPEKNPQREKKIRRQLRTKYQYFISKNRVIETETE